MIVFDKVIAAGDSLTSDFPRTEYQPDRYIINHGLYGDNLTAFTERFRLVIAPEKPDLIFILIGINDFALGRKYEDIILSYELLVTLSCSILPQSIIYMTSLLPTRGVENRPNSAIVQVNSSLKKICENAGIGYFDLHREFCATDGAIKEEYTTDGLHLTSEGYQVWQRALTPLIDKISSDI